MNTMIRYQRSEYKHAGYDKEVIQSRNRMTLLRNEIKHILKSKLNLKIVPNNAFIKLFEILKLNPFLIPKKNKVYTFHLAEAPGLFYQMCRSIY